MILDNRPPLRISLVKRVALLLFAVVVLPLSARAFPEKDADTKTSATGTELRWNLTEGETLRYSLQIRQNGGISVFPVQEVQNPQHKHSASQQIDMEWRIQETNPDGSTIVSMRIPRFILNRKTAFANQNIQYDSKLNKTEDENLRKVSRTVLESEYRFIVNSQGKIKKLTLSENLLEILKNTKVIRDKPYSFFTAFHAEHLERELNAVLFSHPAKTVSKGATWSKTEKWPLANVMVVSNNRHLYHGPTDENLHKIELTANIKTHPMFDEEDDPNKNIKIVFKNGENKGTVLFDNHSGRIRESRYQQSFSWISKPQLSDVQIEKLSKADADKVREARIIQTLTTKTTLRLQPAGN